MFILLRIIIKDYNCTILRSIEQNTIIGGQVLYNVVSALCHIADMNWPQVYVCPLPPEPPHLPPATYLFLFLFLIKVFVASRDFPPVAVSRGCSLLTLHELLCCGAWALGGSGLHSSHAVKLAQQPWLPGSRAQSQ